MGRLTERKLDDCISVDKHWVYSNSPFYQAIKKLAHYEDLEEQGRLIELPCAVGDTVYLLRTDGVQPRIEPHKVANLHYCVSLKERIGKDVFLSEKEAEAKLKELE